MLQLREISVISCIHGNETILYPISVLYVVEMKYESFLLSIFYVYNTLFVRKYMKLNEIFHLYMKNMNRFSVIMIFTLLS